MCERTRSAVLTVVSAIDAALERELPYAVVRDICYALGSSPKADIARGPRRAQGV